MAIATERDRERDRAWEMGDDIRRIRRPIGCEPLQQTWCCCMQLGAAGTKAWIITSGLITTHFLWLSTRCQEQRTNDRILQQQRWELDMARVQCLTHHP